jgi:hypothetical protein
MPTGKSFFSLPRTVNTGTEASEGDSRRRIHFSETRHDHLFINFSAVITAVDGDLKFF